ncbi:unnamed protein product [Peniophora sp. CBMAI 1063]|nr:unnamed protein product [Peniophora sp. CBMAI 1063]
MRWVIKSDPSQFLTPLQTQTTQLTRQTSSSSVYTLGSTTSTVNERLMFPITFNAVGDIATFASLMFDIARALSETRGSPSEYRAFTAELSSLHVVLTSVTRIAESTTDSALRAEIVREVNLCSNDVQRALKRIVKFSALGQESGTDHPLCVKLKRQWFKLEWRFGQRHNVREVRAELSLTTQRLTAYLVIVNSDGIQNLNASLTDHFDIMTARICTSLMHRFAITAAPRTSEPCSIRHSDAAVLVGDLQRTSQRVYPDSRGGRHTLDTSKAVAVGLLCVAICTMCDTSHSIHTALLFAAVGILLRGIMRDNRIIAPVVGYTHSNSMTLHDALGQRLVLPLELCATHDAFHATLVNMFKDMDGHWFIDAQRYTITRVDNTCPIRACDWALSVKSGAEVEMSVFVQWGGFPCSILCPACLVVIEREVCVNEAECGECGRTLTRATSASAGRSILGSTSQVSQPSVNEDGRGRSSQTRQEEATGEEQDKEANRKRRLHEGNQSTLGLSWRSQIRQFRRIQIQETEGLELASLDDPVVPSTDRREFLTAAENGHYPLVSALIQRGMDVNVQGRTGYTALHLASYNGHTDVVELLLDQGASVDAATKDDITPFACTVARGHLEVSTLLLARGAIVNAPQPMQVVALYAAAGANNIDVARMLLRLGVDANACIGKHMGRTALHAAVWAKSSRMVEVLLQHGADVNACSSDGHTPLSIARRDPGDALIESLLSL